MVPKEEFLYVREENSLGVPVVTIMQRVKLCMYIGISLFGWKREPINYISFFEGDC